MELTAADYREIRRNRETSPPTPWKDLARVYGNCNHNTLRGKYSRWLQTEEGQKKDKYVAPPPAWVVGDHYVIESQADNTYKFGIAGDRHYGSKYHRDDVLQDLYNRFEEAECDYILDTGNWIDGECRFNRFDLTRVGMTPQVMLMAEETPQTDIPTLAVWGDDHEGWYAQREGVDMGQYAQHIMREAGHDWTDLGYMEAHIVLRNRNTGAETIMAVMHPGGGSAYALSYRPQKIVESLEGGEKPALIVMGHYHKLETLNVRNVWVVQAGCIQDQTPFMRKKSIEAHVGGVILTVEQDPESGAIMGCGADMKRYFNRGFYNNRWNRAGDITRATRTIVPPRR